MMFSKKKMEVMQQNNYQNLKKSHKIQIKNNTLKGQGDNSEVSAKALYASSLGAILGPDPLNPYEYEYLDMNNSKSKTATEECIY